MNSDPPAARFGYYALALVAALASSSVEYGFADDSIKARSTPSTRTILFVDDHDVLYRSGTVRRLNTPRRREEPVLSETKPWELAIGYCSVQRAPAGVAVAAGTFQLWYQSYAGPRAKDRTRRVVVAYAESDDGLSWRKPSLGLFDFNGENNTNIVLVGNGGKSVNYGAAVIVDLRDPSPSRRYKMAYWDFAGNLPGLFVAFSPDGKHWTKHHSGPLLPAAYGEPGQPPARAERDTEPDIRPAISDVIDLHFDPRRERHVIYAKTWIDGPDGRRFWKRAVVRTESEDFIRWTKPVLVLVPADDELGQIHGAPVFHRHGVYFGLAQILDFGGFDRGGTGNMPGELIVSRDGVRWSRPFRETAFLPVSGDAKTFDAGCLWTNAMPLQVGDELRFYYGAYPSWNSDHDSSATGIGLRTLSIDRFAALRPRENAAQITLKPIDLSGARGMTLNADARGGRIRVEVLTAGGYRVPGFAKDEARPISVDGTRVAASWQNRTLSDLPPGRYQIRLHLEEAEIYALSIHR